MIELTTEMQRVIELSMTPGAGHLFITGKAGSGKTTLLRYLRENCPRNIVIAAPTGVAAVNAGGQTLHSLFMIPFEPRIPGEPLENNMSSVKRKIIHQMEILVIDEVSMVRPDVLDTVDQRLREVRKNNRPFGGVMLILFGDLFQLPPVIQEEDWKILGGHYQTQFFFSAKVWEKTGLEVIELSRIFRQTDQEFIKILNHIRDYQVTAEDLAKLAGLFGKPGSAEFQATGINLCSTRKTAENINNWWLAREPGVPRYTYHAEISGKFSESQFSGLKDLSLRVGARVMCLTNNIPEYYNGSLGTVTDLGENYVTVKLDTGLEVDFDRYVWENREHKVVGGKVVTETVGYLRQFPLIPAWAITIHKSQGLTFDHVYLHVNRIFSPGQLYVALSRCRSMEGIITNIPIGPSMVIPCTELIEFTDYLRDHGNYWHVDGGHRDTDGAQGNTTEP